MNDQIRSTPIMISQQALDDLQRRLELTRWPERETVGDWSQGVPLNYIQELCVYWQTQYDWRRWETKLNSFSPQTFSVDGLDIHFLHVRSPHSGAMPLIMTHGWPGSVVEFHKVIAPLVDPVAFGGNAAEAFHVVCPSLPGFGFSGKPASAGWNAEKTGRAWGALMAALGYERYGVQGGDAGSAVAHSMALTERLHCLGIHVNMMQVLPDPATMDDLSKEEEAMLAAVEYYQHKDSAYAHIQGTRPQTIGYGLADSPVGQLAWIVDKLWAWCDCGVGRARHLENAVSRDEILDNVMMYWLPNAAASAARLYWECLPTLDMTSVIDLPMGCSLFPGEISLPSRRWAEQRYHNLIYWNRVDRGGHFAALEQPELFVGEVRRFFSLLR
jgi:epoxide hydrolase